MADPADINVDDLRRRARRRLVGAIVLALAAAVIVPMLLESEPKPLGDSVAVKIPPVDDGKFVNRLNDGAPKSDAPAKDVRKDAAPDAAPRKSVADAEKSVMAPAGKPPKYDTQVAADAAKPADAPSPNAAPPVSATPTVPSASTPPQPPPPPAPAADTPTPATAVAPAAKAGAPKADATPKSDPKAAAPAVKAEPKSAEPAAAATPAKNGAKDGFAVQLAAFSDDKGANSLINRLKRDGYPAYIEPLKTSRGTLWRVRVGPFPSRDAANVVRDKLKTEGQNGIVAPTH
jgi:DedD protein